MPSIRDVDPERDAEAVVAILREAQPSAVVSPASWLHRVVSLPERSRSRGFVAEEGGRVVGNGYAFLDFFTARPATAVCQVMVASSHRRRGIGAALWERVEEHARSLAPRSLSALFDETAAGAAFARDRGFRTVRAEAVSVLDPCTVRERPAADVELRTVAQVDPRLAYAVDVAATRDMPSIEPPADMSYEEWEQHVLRHPLFTADGSFVALVDGAPAAVALLTADRESSRAMSFFTGTLREYRGRGLALAVKLASVRWAAEHGITAMLTMNDERNAPMLAVNRRLGYRPAGRRVEYVKRV